MFTSFLSIKCLDPLIAIHLQEILFQLWPCASSVIAILMLHNLNPLIFINYYLHRKKKMEQKIASLSYENCKEYCFLMDFHTPIQAFSRYRIRWMPRRTAIKIFLYVFSIFVSVPEHYIRCIQKKGSFAP